MKVVLVHVLVLKRTVDIHSVVMQHFYYLIENPHVIVKVYLYDKEK
jgi:hypothetical protein